MTPLIARTTGLLGFYLGLSYVAAVVLRFGVVGLYAGIFGYYVWSCFVVAAGFQYGGWAERGSTTPDGEVSD